MTFRLGYQIAGHHYPLPAMLEHVKLMEKAGLDIIWTGDHFHPWFHSGAKEPQAWVFIAAAAARTSTISVGTSVTAPIFRYHPAIVAQTFATLATMFPNRILLGLGTGEAMNEIPLGYTWPSFKERAERLEEAVHMIKLLWSREFVNYKGKYYRMKKANLYSKPETPLPLYLAAFGSTVAKLAGKYADGLITPSANQQHIKDVLFPALAEGAIESGRDPANIEKVLEINTMYDRDPHKAMEYARKWGAAALPYMFKLPIYDPREIEEFSRIVSDEAIAKTFVVGSEPEDFVRPIENAIELGFTQVYVTGTTPDEPGFVDLLAKHVIPYVKSTYADH